MSDLKDPGVYKPLVIGFMLMVFQQMTGINAIMFYAENIFEEAHFKVIRTEVSVLCSITNAFNLAQLDYCPVISINMDLLLYNNLNDNWPVPTLVFSMQNLL